MLIAFAVGALGFCFMLKNNKFIEIIHFKINPKVSQLTLEIQCIVCDTKRPSLNSLWGRV